MAQHPQPLTRAGLDPDLLRLWSVDGSGSNGNSPLTTLDVVRGSMPATAGLTLHLLPADLHNVFLESDALTRLSIAPFLQPAVEGQSSPRKDCRRYRLEALTALRHCRIHALSDHVLVPIHFRAEAGSVHHVRVEGSPGYVDHRIPEPDGFVQQRTAEGVGQTQHAYRSVLPSGAELLSAQPLVSALPLEESFVLSLIHI